MATGDQIERKYLAHFIDAAFNAASPSYVRLGKDLEEYNEELNPDVEIQKNIWGEQTVKHSGYEVQSEVGTYMAYEGDPLFTQLCLIANERRTGNACKTTRVDVLLDASGTVIWAYREDVKVVPSSIGGDTSGVNVPFTIYSEGNRTAGTWDNGAKTFTPGATGSTRLSALTISDVTLSPEFDSGTFIYSGSTTASSSTITATAVDNTATVAIVLNGSSIITSGSSSAAEWSSASSGLNTVTATVTKSGQSSVYTVTVTKT